MIYRIPDIICSDLNSYLHCGSAFLPYTGWLALTSAAQLWTSGATEGGIMSG